LATFRVVTYAPYKVYPNATLRNSVVFHSPRQFHQWEAAIELRAIYEKVLYLHLKQMLLLHLTYCLADRLTG
jgi:hypothetical protein